MTQEAKQRADDNVCLSDGCNKPRFGKDSFCAECGDRLDEWLRPLGSY